MQLFKNTKDPKFLYYAKKLNRKAHYIANNDKINFYAKKIQLAGKDPKKIWHIISNFTKSPKSTTNINKIIHNNQTITNPTDIANIFNEYFTSSINSLINSQNKTPPNINQYSNSNKKNIPIFNFNTTSFNEVQNISISVKQSKNQDNNNSMPTKLWSNFNEILLKHITYYINNSFETSTFPNNLKLSIINPIHKSGPITKIENYRPISNLPYLSKLFEKVAYQQITFHLNEHNLIYDYQFGFRPNMSTETALNILIDTIINHFENDNLIAVTFLDFTKAFDSVNHDILLNKLKSNFNFSFKTIQWIESYIKYRQQKVIINNHTSTTKPIQHGVPQGSILGPILFNLMVNDMHECTKNSSTILIQYADDTVLITGKKYPDILLTEINTVLNNISKYCFDNQLFINCSKTKTLIINNKQHYKFENKIFIDQSSIEITSEYKYLGFIIDSQLKFTAQKNMIIKKLTSSNYALQRAKYLLPKNYLINIYYALSISHIIYNKSLLIGMSKNQNKFIQHQLMLSGSIIDNCKIKYVLSHMFNLQYQLEYYNYIKFYNILKKNKDICLYKNFKLHSHPYSTRHKYTTFNPTRFKINLSKICHKYFAVKLWNSLPKSISSAQSFSKFQSELKQYLIAIHQQ